MSVSNTLELSMAVALVAPDRLEVRSATCTHLPWLDRNETVWPSVRAALELPFCEALEGIAKEGSQALVKAISKAKDSVQELLEREFRIAVEVSLLVRVEESGVNVAEAVLWGLSDATRQQIGEILTNGQFTWVPFDNLLEEQSARLTRKDLPLSSAPTVLVPGSKPSVFIEARRAFLMHGIRIKVGDYSIDHNDSRVVPEGRAEISLPEIPVADYSRFDPTLGESELECFVGSNARAIAPLNLKLQLPPLEQPPVAAFLDMGSTQTKFLTVELSTDPLPKGAPDGGWCQQLRHDLRRAVTKERLNSRIASMEVPDFTTDFVSARKMPGFDKAKLDKLDDQELLAWFESAIRGLAMHVAREKKRLLSHVYWSFPNTRNRDFVHLNEEINRRVGHAVLGRIFILAEHDCLRLRFGKILHTLADRAQNRHREKTEAEKNNQERQKKLADANTEYRKQKNEYDKSWFFVRWVTSTPKQPNSESYKELEVPTLEEWQRSFRHIHADETLENSVVFDAGGYSLDVVAQVGGSERLAESYEIGGNLMTAGLRQFLAEERHVAVEEVPWGEAESQKCYICRSIKPQEHRAAYRRCRELTAEIYDEKLNQVAKWIAERGTSKGVPVILTGGGMGNRFLRERIKDILKEHGLRSHATHSVELTTLLSEDGASHPATTNIDLFNAVSKAFSDEEPVTWYDVLGGLAQHALAE